MTTVKRERKLEAMRDILRSLERVVVAFSAGVDSTFVLKAAVDTLGRENVIAATSRSESVPDADCHESVRIADSLGVEHVMVDTREFDDPNYLSNPVNRCYFCKTALYDVLVDLAAERGFAAIVNGVNADDLGDWRPGIAAGGEHKVRSPAAEAGLTKEEIRALSREMGLTTSEKPASPCLSSRVQYGEAITPDKLRMIESCEAYLRGLGVGECRVRHHGNLARIEVPAEYIEELVKPGTRRAIEEHFRSAGYAYVTVDLRGFRSGSLNEVINVGVPSSGGEASSK